MRKTRINDIFIINNFIDRYELDIIQECLSNVDWLPDEQSPNFYVNLTGHGDDEHVSDKAIRILQEKRDLLQRNIEQDFNCQVSEEGIGTIVKYHIGWTLELHADCWNELPTYAGYPSRDISSLVYLTDDFEGGNLFFPDLDIEIEPVAGSAIYFPGNNEHLHEVKELLSGNRATCTGFWHILNKETK